VSKQGRGGGEEQAGGRGQSERRKDKGARAMCEQAPVSALR